ncbi:MAG TPA: hypothetical protein VIK35_08315 [Verrucomicrobiae bacterium]
MKQFSAIILACALTIPALAQEAKTNAVAAAGIQPPGQLFLASAAVVTAPIVLTNDYFYLASAASDMAEVADGGKAVFNFTITNAGDYVVETLVNADDESTNSFFVNMDAQPTEPDMIWDIDVTSGFEKRIVNWRGSGDSGTDEFAPKRFKLEPGAHTLVIVGREPGTLLKSLTIRPAATDETNSPSAN